LVLCARPREERHMKYEGLKRHPPPPAGSIMLVPAGSPGLWRCSGRRDLLFVYLEPGLVERVAADAFDLDPARVVVPPLDQLHLPPLRAAMEAVNPELTTRGAGGPLAPDALANLLALHLFRH